MSAQHTPGPWHYAEPFMLVKNAERGEVRVRGIGNGAVHVGYASITLATGSKEALANAKLMASAPELLAALQEALPFIPHTVEGYKDVLHPVLSRARKAIAKAVKDGK